MKKRLLLFCFVIASALSSFGNHITGGEMFYTYLGKLSNGNHHYSVTLKIYKACGSLAPLDAFAPIGIFANDGSQAPVSVQQVPLKNPQTLTLVNNNPCITNPPEICYDVGYYEFTIDLPPNASGYTLAFQRCCRIAGINNVFSSDFFGATYTAEIPGMNALTNAPENNSAQFIGEDLVVLCANAPMTYDFGAKDADPNDQLVYYFGPAYTGGGRDATGGSGFNSPLPNPPAAPSYGLLDYAPPYSSSSPLGPKVTINSSTGLVTGIAPPEGIYVVTVYVDEIRNGVRIATQRKDLQIKVADCQLAIAALDPEYITCDGFTRTFTNNVTSPLINSYNWEFGDPASGANNTSTLENPTHTFLDTGIYTITLTTNKGQECSSTATAIVKVYPGFFPGFTSSGICVNKPTRFFDTSKTVYGVIDKWSWNFGDGGTLADTSRLQNPTYTFNQLGAKNVGFIVSSSKGCIDTIFQTVNIVDKPPVDLLFKDTVICRGDALQLQATGSGIYTWTPNTEITNTNTATPTVTPSVTRTYYVNLNDNDCINQDSVRVKVVTVVNVTTPPPVTICHTDSVQLLATSDGLRFEWTPVSQINNPALLNPMARPPNIGANTYTITAYLGGCVPATADFIVNTVPYPTAIAVADSDVLCFGTSTSLNAVISGNSFTWSPLTGLSNANTLNPTAAPLSTTQYILTVTDPASGCPKPSKDTVLVTVLPKINPFAGKDTSVVVGQPLQLEASGGSDYLWSPSTGLNNVNIFNPVGLYSGEFDSIRYKVQVFDEAGCSDSATVLVKIFKTAPQVFVPTAFTPNKDGKNDVIRPIAVGITKIEYFRIFNRWGQMVFSTTTNGQGWDGRIKGKDQGTNVYVWIVKAVDFTGKEVFAKGTVTLIR